MRYTRPLDLLTPEEREAIRPLHRSAEPYHTLESVAGDAQKIFGYLRQLRTAAPKK